MAHAGTRFFILLQTHTWANSLKLKYKHQWREHEDRFLTLSALREAICKNWPVSLAS
jgi:hypothetical protein